MLKSAVTKENALYIVNVVITLLVLYWLYSIVAAVSSSKEAITTTTIVATYAVVIVIYIFFAKGIMAHFRGNGIRVSEQQFPEVYAIYKAELQKLGIRKEPKLYCVQSNGVLNAFATRIAFHNYVVVYSEILQAGIRERRRCRRVRAGPRAGPHQARPPDQELLHLSGRRDLSLSTRLLAGVRIHLRSHRAPDYSDKAVDGLVILAAGKKLGGLVNIPEYVRTARDEHGFWVWFAEFMSTHPNLPKKRIGRLQSFETTPMNP